MLFQILPNLALLIAGTKEDIRDFMSQAENPADEFCTCLFEGGYRAEFEGNRYIFDGTEYGLVMTRKIAGLRVNIGSWEAPTAEEAERFFETGAIILPHCEHLPFYEKPEAEKTE